MKQLSIAVLLACSAVQVSSQIPENISLGLYGRGETNFYRYYAGKELGSFFSTRVNNAYSAGISAHSSINYLFNAGASFGFSEVSYRPDIRTGSSTLYQASIRFLHLNMTGELKFNEQGTFNPTFWMGMQGMFRQEATELFSAGRVEERLWPKNRWMPQFGLGFHYRPGKHRWHARAELGMRLNSNNRTGYDWGLSQVFAGLHLLYRVKSW